MRNIRAMPAVLVLLAAAAITAQPNQVIPAAATVASSPTEGKPMVLDFQQLGECTADSGLSPVLEYCQTQSALNKPGQAHWYRFNVQDSDSAFTLHFLTRVQNGRVRMGLWFPGQGMDTEPSVSADILLSSSFAQEQYITIPAAQLFHSPGIYMLQIMNEYGAPRYSLRADLTPATTLMAEEDRKAVEQIVKDCCPDVNGMVCHSLSQATTADSIENDLCHQGAVQCDKEGHITDLVLQGSNSDADLSCSAFSAGFAALPQLHRLDLAGANLAADLPTIGKALAPATHLRWLVLRSAGVVGDISCDIILPSLHLLSLTRNGITGKIPNCFTQTKTLLHLYLSDNALSGPLPDFSPDSSLELLFARDLYVDGKPSLGGVLPASLSTATNLQFLQLSNTGLSGGIPVLPPNMKYFNMSDNGLSGPLPVLPTSIVSLDFSANDISGALPADMTAYTNMVDIQAYYNKLEGPLPAKLPHNLVQLAVSGNSLSGPVPALPRGMRYLSVAQNQLDGELPDGPGAAGLWFADLSSNQFSGKIPAALGQSAELVYLNVSRNQLDGIEAPGSWSTPALLTLDASYNNIAGTVMAELTDQPHLAYINLASNKLSGNLEAFAAALKVDTNVGAVFDVSSNQLTGGLPQGLANLAVFSTAPTSFPSWNELGTSGYPAKVFNVADNNLSGPFPAFLYSSLVGLVAQYCNDDPGSCNLRVSLNGGNNRLTCPAKLQPGIDAVLPEDFTLLQKQSIGCNGKDGALYEIASVLEGKPALLKVDAKPAKPAAQPGDASETVAAAAPIRPRGHGDAQSKSVNAEQPAHHANPFGLPPAAFAGIIAGAVAVIAMLAAFGYVVVYRRWYTVRAAQSFKKMHEGPLAATGGATVNSSAPIAGLPNLTAPPPAAGAAGVLGGDDRV